MIEFVILPLASFETKRLITFGVLALLGLAMLAAVAIFGLSIWRQRKYNKSTLPSFTEETKEEEEDAASAFDLDSLAEEPTIEKAFAHRIDDSYAFETLEEVRPTVDEPEEFTLPQLEEIAPPPRTYESKAYEPEVKPEVEELALPEYGPMNHPDDFTFDDGFDDSPMEPALPSLDSPPVQPATLSNNYPSFMEEDDDDYSLPEVEEQTNTFSKLRRTGFDKMSSTKVTEEPLVEPQKDATAYEGRRRA